MVDHNLHEIKKKMHPFFDVFVKIIIESIKNSVDYLTFILFSLIIVECCHVLLKNL